MPFEIQFIRLALTCVHVPCSLVDAGAHVIRPPHVIGNDGSRVTLTQTHLQPERCYADSDGLLMYDPSCDDETLTWAP